MLLHSNCMIFSTEKHDIDRKLVVKSSSFEIQMYNDIYVMLFIFMLFVIQVIPNHFETIQAEK